MIRTNIDKLVKMSVVGEISHRKAKPYTITADGRPVVRPGTGGITYNIRVGDSIAGWVADHVEPCVSIKNSDSNANNGLNTLTCIGNEASLIGGEAKGEKGTVTGKHGGIEHILVDFPPETLDKLNIGDKMLIKAICVGFELPDFPEVTVMNLSPKLFSAMELDSDGDSLVVPVTHKIPARIMGSGLGSNHAYRGDYDIQMFDESTVKEYGLDTLIAPLPGLTIDNCRLVSFPVHTELSMEFNLMQHLLTTQFGYLQTSDWSTRFIQNSSSVAPNPENPRSPHSNMIKFVLPILSQSKFHAFVLTVF